jgi:hypothetical protein
MDTSATVRKAVTEADKQKHCAEGRCYECSKQGHLACDCPDRQSQVKTVSEAPKTETPKISELPDFSNGETLANHALKLTDEARDAFIKRVMMMGEEMGFLGA